ncbi:MAG TPA: SIS domain-containing protein [Acidobacteria bacterium]|nr:SIS domain-containing protein [Acidobacteriota bacterium]
MSDKEYFFNSYFDELSVRLRDVSADQLGELSQVFVNVRDKGGKVIIVGNGGSAAIASHVAVDLTKAARVRAINFNEADLITCFGNDYGYENWMAKALEFYSDAGDVAVIISSSGQSQNVVIGAKAARDLGLQVVTLSGFRADNPLRAIGDLNLWVNSESYNIVETTHQAWLLAVIDRLVETGQ